MFLPADVRHAIRRLRAAPSFSITALATLALCFGVNCALLSFLDTLVLRPQPGIGEPHELLQLTVTGARGAPAYPSRAEFEALHALPSHALDIAYYEPNFVALSSAQGSARLMTAYVSTDYFAVLHATASRGRTLIAADFDARNGEQPAVISWRLWQTQFGGAPSVVGTRVQVNGRPGYTIIGVTQKGFHGPEGLIQADIWLPSSPAGSGAPGRLLARVRTGWTIAQARSEAQLLWGRVQAGESAQRSSLGRPPLDRHLHVAPLRAGLQPENAGVLRLLLGGALAAALVVLAIACMNLGGLSLARAQSQQRELAVRRALGASRGRIARVVLLETGLLFAGGALLGLVLARPVAAIFVRAVNTPVPFALPYRLDPTTLAATAVLTLVAALACALVPVFRASGVDAALSLRADATAARSGGRLRRIQDAFVVTQIACAFLLVSGAVAILFTARRTMHRDIGISAPASTFFLTVRSATGRADSATSRRAELLMQRIRELPQVVGVAYANRSPASGSLSARRIATALSLANPAPPRRPQVLPTNEVSPSFFAVAGVPVLRGRAFTRSDDSTSPRVAIVSRRMAERLFPASDALGQRLVLGDSTRTAQIVGIVGDVVYEPSDRSPTGAVYLPGEQSDPIAARRSIIVQARGVSASFATTLDSLVRAVAPDAPAQPVETVMQMLRDATAGTRAVFDLLAVAALLALMLAAIGVYGLLAYNARQRVREVGVRVALGSTPQAVVRRFARHGLIVSVAGVIIGVGLAVVVVPLVPASLAPGPGPGRRAAIVAALVLTVTATASAVAAVWRTAHEDPMEALRAD